MAVELLTDLKGYWKLDESSGNAADASGNGNTLVNQNTTPFVAAKLNNGADFERGSSQNFGITDASQTGLDFTGDFTLSFWWKPESLVEGGFIEKDSGSGSNREYGLGFNGVTTVNLTIPGSDGNPPAGGPATWTQTFVVTTWYHVLVTYTISSGNGELFINGSSLGTDTTGATAINSGTAPFEIGGNGTISGYNDGVMDEVGAWARKLNADEIAALYGSGTPPSYDTFTGAASGPANLKSLDTNLKANIKSINTNLIANVKTFDTNA